MIIRPVVILGVVVAMLTTTAAAQQPPARPAPPGNPPAAAAPAPPAPAAPAPPARAPRAAAAPAAPAPPAQLVNIRIEVAVVEDGGAQPPARKVTSLTLADRQNGSVRAMASPAPVAGENPAPLQRMFVDAFPMMQRDGRVQVQLTLEYGRPGATIVRVEPLLESGRMMVVSESADPLSDRRIRVELTATIFK